jgi:hypothetical protein
VIFILTYCKLKRNLYRVTIMALFFAPSGFSIAGSVLGAAAASYLRLIEKTCRWNLSGFERLHQMVDDKRPFVGAFWHGQIPMIPILVRDLPDAHMLVSAEKESDVIARTVSRLGFHTVRGARGGQADQKGRRGAAAAVEMIDLLRQGKIVGVTPDGPLGPYQRASLGLVSLAKRSQCPILCGAWAARRTIQFRRWDRLSAPLPFTDCAAMIGELIHVPEDATPDVMEAKRKSVESMLNDLTGACARRVGRVEATSTEAPAITEKSGGGGIA